MIDLQTHYLGLALNNPLVPSSSPLTGDFDTVRRLEDLGAAAIVLPSLFEEELVHEQHQMARFLDHQALGHAEAESFLPVSPHYRSALDAYLERIERFKSALAIPVIGSLNGVSETGWLENARLLEQAGCDALEINLFDVVFDPSQSSDQVERRYLGIVHRLVEQVNLPITVKLCSQITAMAHFVQRIESAGAKGVVCFNRFYQPDIDLETLHLVPRVQLSSATESWQRIRWLGVLRSQSKLSLAATGGFHDHLDTAKALLAGADIVHLCSALLLHGIEHLNEIRSRLIIWMREQEYESVEQMKGSLSRAYAPNSTDYARANYVQILKSYESPPGVKR